MPNSVVKTLTLADLPEVDDHISPSSEYYKRNVVPVDRGWAWVICFAGFLVYFVFGVSNQTLVVLFVELINMYNTTITMGSLVFMFSVFSVGFTSILSTNFLAPRFGERAVVCCAGFFNMCGTLGLSFAPNIGVFIIMGVLKGMATGAVFVPSISLIRLYFQNRRSIAQIIANIGQSAAVILVPSAIRIIRKEYGISGTFIVVAGFELHMTLAGLLLRPISAYKFRPRIVRKKSNQAMAEVLISEDYNEFKLDMVSSKSTLEFRRSKTADEHLTADDNMGRSGSAESALYVLEITPRAPISPAPKTRFSEGGVSQKEDNILPSSGNAFSNTNNPNSELSKQNIINDDNKGETEQLKRKSIVTFSDKPLKTVKINKRRKSSLAAISRKAQYISGIRAMSLFIENIEEGAERRWLFRMVLLATIPGSANLYVRNYIPAIAEGQDANLDESAILLTIVGAMDLISRLCIGLFADTHILTSVQIIIITQLCLAAVCHCLRFFTGFNSLIVFAVLLGCFIGTRISVLPLLAIEIVGLENMPQALSFISTIGAISSAFMNPIFGSVAQSRGNYILVMNLVGACFTASSLILICMPPVILLRRMVRQSKEPFIPRELSAEQKDAESTLSEILEKKLMGSNVDVKQGRRISFPNAMKEPK